MTTEHRQHDVVSSPAIAAVAVYILFFLSGFCGLVYEIIWMRRLAVNFGNTTYAITVVLAAFMGGLAAGSSLFGRLADSPGRRRSLLGYYGWMEIAIGVYCLAFDSLLGAQRSALLAIYGVIDPTGALSLLVKFVLSAALLILPTLLMGGTLPILIKALSRRLPEVGSVTGRLYFINSTGAVVGTLAAAFWMIPSLGLPFSTAAAAAVNILVGLAALGMRGYLAEPEPSPGEAESSVVDEPAPAVSGRIVGLTLAGIFISGFTAMVYEISWTRILSMILGSSTYSFALMLAAFISGIALGGLLISSYMRRITSPARAFAVLQGVIALSVLAMLPLYSRLPLFFIWVRQVVAFNYAMDEAFKFVVCLLVMIVPATAFGMGFPLVARLAAGRLSQVAGKVGGVYALNTLGNIAGSVLCGLVMIPLLGIKLTIETAVLLNLAVCLAVLTAIEARGRRMAVVYTVSGIALAAYYLLLPGWDRHLLTGGAFRYHSSVNPEATAGNFYRSAHDREFVYYREGISTTVSVERDGEALMLRVNGKVDASNVTDMNTQYLLAHLPMLLHPGPRRVLVIGVGSGATCGATLAHSGLERLVCVEISPGVAEASRYFSDINRRYWEDPRTELVIDDGRNYMFRDESQWDVITSEPSNPWIAGIGNLYTQQFYADCVRRLAPGGLICQWIHLYEMDESVLKTILITFTRAFPHALAFCSVENNDLLLIGSLEPVREDFEAITRRMGEPQVAADLKRIGITRLFTLLAAQVFDQQGMRLWAGIGPVNSDDFPLVEYSAPRGFFHASRVELPTEYRLAGADNLLSRYLASCPATADDLVETAGYQNVTGMTYMVSSTLADALEREPEHAGALELMTRLLTGRNKYAEAQGYLERLRAAGADERMLLELEYPLATALAERRGASLVTPPDFSRAAEIKLRLIELESEFSAAHYYDLGETYHKARRWIEAAQAFERALVANESSPVASLPEKPMVLHRIGESLMAAGEPERAMQVYSRLLEEFPDNPLGVSMLRLIAYQRLLEQSGTPDMERIRELFSN